MVRSYTGSESSKPLEGTTILITGATNGIGLSLTRALSNMGGTVVALGRSKAKLAMLREEIPSVRSFQVDLTDLAAVSRTADEITSSMKSIDILINNAGIHATSNFFGENLAVGQNTSYDRVFVVNYLSHFLLSEKMIPLLNKSQRRPVIMQTTSSFHWAVDGSDLTARPEKSAMPIAARPGGSRGFYVFRTQRSYSNSKLAQIYHARIMKQYNPEIRTVSFCPGWVATNIGGSNVSWTTMLLARVAFSVDEWGIGSALHALFGNGEDDDDYFINSNAFRLAEFIFPKATPAWVYRLGLRDWIALVFAMVGLWTQNLAPYAGPSRSSPESYNLTMASALYDWSKSAVAGYI